MDPISIAVLILSIASLVVAFLLPLPDIAAGNSPGLDEFEHPTADKNRVVNEVFGTVLIKGANTIYFGELRKEDIYSS